MSQADESPYLSTPEAAAILGVSVSTVKRWVDDGILPAHKTAGGHRKLLRAEVLAMARRGGFPRGDLSILSLREPADTLAEALLHGDGVMTTCLIRRLYESGMSIEVLADRVVSPALAKVGHDWEQQRIDVWQEHRGSQLCAAALFDLREELQNRAERERPLALGGAPGGDPYLVPSLLVELTLLDNGWEATNLGPDTPLKSLAHAIQELQPKLVWLSVTYIRDEQEFIAGCARVFEEVVKIGALLAVGGQALSSSSWLRSQIPHSFYGETLSQFASFAQMIHPRPKCPRRGRPRRSS
jgi:excisionase family DNA binding protein